jgi:hypothetical protein
MPRNWRMLHRDYLRTQCRSWNQCKTKHRRRRWCLSWSRRRPWHILRDPYLQYDGSSACVYGTWWKNKRKFKEKTFHINCFWLNLTEPDRHNVTSQTYSTDTINDADATISTNAMPDAFQNGIVKLKPYRNKNRRRRQNRRWAWCCPPWRLAAHAYATHGNRNESNTV